MKPGWLPPGGDLVIECDYQPGDGGQAILNQGLRPDGLVYVQLRRTWRDRLCTWPWRPWVKLYGEAVPMRVTERVVHDRLGQVTYTLEQVR